MDTRLARLDPAVRDEIRLLYLASYAPDHLSSPPELDSEDGIVPKYHFELAKVLDEIGVEFDSSSCLDDVLEAAEDYDYVFSIYNRAPFRNSEVFTSSVCEYFDVPYLGARPHVRSLAEDKHLTKVLTRSLGLPTPQWCAITRQQTQTASPDFDGPYILKPRFGAASRGIEEESVVESWSEAADRLRGFEPGSELVVEEFIPGANVTVPVLVSEGEPWALPPVETVARNSLNVQTYSEKRFLDKGAEKRPYTNEEVASDVTSIAKSLFDSLHPIDYYRADFRVREDTHESVLLEMNVCCNLGSHASMSTSASFLGIDQKELVEHVLATSIRRQGVV